MTPVQIAALFVSCIVAVAIIAGVAWAFVTIAMLRGLEGEEWNE